MIDSDLDSTEISKISGISDKMKIAFRYQNLPTADSARNQYRHIGHLYDLSKNMSFSDIENSDICYWNGQRIENGKSFKMIL